MNNKEKKGKIMNLNYLKNKKKSKLLWRKIFKKLKNSLKYITIKKNLTIKV